MENDLHATLNSPLAESARQITNPELCPVLEPLSIDALKEIEGRWKDAYYSPGKIDVLRLLATIRYYQHLWINERATLHEVRVKLLEVKQLIGELK